jgi:hypothetical protein
MLFQKSKKLKKILLIIIDVNCLIFDYFFNKIYKYKTNFLHIFKKKSIYINIIGYE